MRGPKVLQALRLEAYTDEAGSRLPGSGGYGALGKASWCSALMVQLRLERGIGLHMGGREAGRGKRGHFLLRQLWEQRQENVNHRACSGNRTR